MGLKVSRSLRGPPVASHTNDDPTGSGRDKVTLVIERVSNATTRTSQRQERATLESLQDVLKRDLQTPPGQEAGASLSLEERGKRLLGEMDYD